MSNEYPPPPASGDDSGDGLDMNKPSSSASGANGWGAPPPREYNPEHGDNGSTPYQPGVYNDQGQPYGQQPYGAGSAGYYGGSNYASSTGAVNDNEKLLVYLSYLGGIFFSWSIPIVLFFVARGSNNPWQLAQQKNSLNFQITLFIGYFVSILLTVILVGYIMIFAVWIWSIVVAVKACMAAARGEVYDVPGAIRFLS